MATYIVVFITTPKNKVNKIVKHLFQYKLVACVNEIENVKSTYFWEGKICNDKESLLVIKTKKSLFELLVSEVKKVHPYSVPEIIAIPVIDGNKEYLKWIDDVTKTTRKR